MLIPRPMLHSETAVVHGPVRSCKCISWRMGRRSRNNTGLF